MLKVASKCCFLVVIVKYVESRKKKKTQSLMLKQQHIELKAVKLMSLVVFPLPANRICWIHGSVSHFTGALCTSTLISLCTCILGTHVKTT